MTENPAVVLTIAASDPSAGAGIQADLKTCQALGAYALTAITALSIQNTQGVKAIEPCSAELLAAQLAVLQEDMAFGAIKIGALINLPLLEVVTDFVQQVDCPVILDPVLIASSGKVLLEQTAWPFLIQQLLPEVDLLSPNCAEAAVLLDIPAEQVIANRQAACLALLELGPKRILLTGGDVMSESVDDYYYDGEQFEIYQAPKIQSQNTHGTGCTLSSAIAALVAQGHDWPEAVRQGIMYCQQAIKAGQHFRLGQGAGPLWHG